MTGLPVRLSTRASADIAAVQRWDDTQSPGLGTRFVENVRAAVRRVAAMPELYQQRRGDACRAPVEGFSDYGVWYRVLPDHSLVIACVSGRRHEAIIRQRLLGIV